MLFGRSLTKLQDEALIVRLQAGEGRALDELYRRYSPLLLRYFQRMLWQDKALAEDALHDVFMKIIENPNHVDPARKFSTWIYSVAHNYSKNQYRKQAFRKSLNGKFTQPGIMPAIEGKDIDHSSFEKALEQVLIEEGEDLRTMLVMRHELEMGFAEIGAVLDCPEGTVKSRLFYLKKRLALALDSYKVILEK